MKEAWLTLKSRRYRGHLSLWEYHIWRLYKKYVMEKTEGLIYLKSKGGH